MIKFKWKSFNDTMANTNIETNNEDIAKAFKMATKSLTTPKKEQMGGEEIVKTEPIVKDEKESEQLKVPDVIKVEESGVYRAMQIPNATPSQQLVVQDSNQTPHYHLPSQSGYNSGSNNNVNRNHTGNQEYDITNPAYFFDLEDTLTILSNSILFSSPVADPLAASIPADVVPRQLSQHISENTASNSNQNSSSTVNPIINGTSSPQQVNEAQNPLV